MNIFVCPECGALNNSEYFTYCTCGTSKDVRMTDYAFYRLKREIRSAQKTLAQLQKQYRKQTGTTLK